MSSPAMASNLTAHVRAAWDTQIAAARRTPGLLPTLVRHRREILPRFAECYRQLNALPRRVRRRLLRRWRRCLAGIALALTLGIAGPADAAAIDVDGTTCTLVDAITAANTDSAVGGCTAGSGADTIVLPAGSTQTLSDVNNHRYGANGLPLVTTDITIEGHGSTIRRDSGAPAFRILFVERSGTLTLRNTTISGGATSSGWLLDEGGGAGLNYYGTLSLVNCTISGNVATGSGGGIYNYYGSLSISNSTVSGNTAGRGGGGIYNYYGTLTVAQSTISGNTAGSAGGGVGNNGFATLTDSTISGNVARDGGGIANLTFLWGNTLTIVNSTISGNVARFAGGGVNNFRSAVAVLTNVTITGNSAGMSGGAGGGVFHDSSWSFTEGPHLTLIRSLIAGNNARFAPEIGSLTSSDVVADNFNLFGHDAASGIVGFSPGPTDVVPTGPLNAILDPVLADNGGPTFTHALVFGSPAVDAVTSGVCPDTDQRGFARPTDGDGTPEARCDVGAFELPAVDDLLCHNVISSRGNTCTAGSANEGNACETEEQCGGTPDVTAFCKPSTFGESPRVSLTDRRETTVFDVKKPVSLCTPAGGSEVQRAARPGSSSLAAYHISVARWHRWPARLTNLTVTNRFGSVRVDTILPARLLVPSATGAASGAGTSAATTDHFACHLVKRSKWAPPFPKGVQTTVGDQFTPPTLYNIKKPSRLCMPVDKDGTSPGAEQHRTHLMCYRVERATGPSRDAIVRDIRVSNALGSAEVDAIRDEELCVPSQVTP